MYPLRIENRRVLVPFGERCPFGCRYCYARSEALHPGKLDPAAIVDAVAALPAKDFDIIQLGYDGDPLANRPRFMFLLSGLWQFGKHINVSTKGVLTRSVCQFIDDLTAGNRSRVSALISFSCWDSASFVEPHTPTPNRRVETIRRLSELDISTFVALRPILPEIEDSELETVVLRSATAGARAVVAGPLYVDDAGRFVSTGIDKRQLARPVDVSWSPIPVQWHRYEDVARLSALRDIARRASIPMYTSSVVAIQDAVSGRLVSRVHVMS